MGYFMGLKIIRPQISKDQITFHAYESDALKRILGSETCNKSVFFDI